ncbi:MAG: TolB family protein [Methanohalobium sp.]|uniref:TolB family protein n=1 Tax=Methanohalobium sp. TaxID=2837493 RepID=UPI003978CFC5
MWLINRNGTDKKQLTNDEFDNIDPVFNLDGEWIAFSSNRNGNYDIWVMKPRKGNYMVQLTSTNSTQKKPSWSPNGDKLVYTSNEDGNYNIWLITLNISKLESSGNELEDSTDTSTDSVYNHVKNVVTNNFLTVMIAGISGMIILMIFFFKRLVNNL